MKYGMSILGGLVIVGLIAGGAAYIGLTGGMNQVEAAIEIGGEMPDFTLTDTDGTEHTLSEYLGQVVVLEFCSQECPYSRGADPHLNELAAQFADDEVVFIGIDSHRATTVEQIAEYREEAGKEYPVVKDEGNAYADEVGANVTPEVIIVDAEGNVAYHGAFDNRTNPAKKGDEAYVADAIVAVLAGQSVDPSRVQAWGCSIKRAK